MFCLAFLYFIVKYRKDYRLNMTNFIKVQKENRHYIYRIAGIKIKINKHRSPKSYILKHKRELLYKIKRFLNKFSKCKKYDFIITLGMNCNFSEAFLKYFRFSDSTFWNWVSAYKCAREQILVMKDIESLLRGGFEYRGKMWSSKTTGLAFHGRTPHAKLIQADGTPDKKQLDADLDELISRITYLHKKTRNYIASDKRKLFVYTMVSRTKEDVQGCVENAGVWYEYLQNHSKNFDFLVICARQYFDTVNAGLKEKYPDIYVRKLKSNYENGQVLHLDIIGWSEIFKEFRPVKIEKSKNKTLKYDKL